MLFSAIFLILLLSLLMGIDYFLREFQPPLLKKSDLECQGCNLILISIDTLRADHLSAYGYPRQTSPFLDEAKKNAITFTSVVSTSSLTPDAHMSLFTSLLPSVHRVKVTDNGTFVDELWQEYIPSPMDERFTTLAELLKAQGYATYAITGGGFVDAYFGFGKGFDTYTSFSDTAVTTKSVHEELLNILNIQSRDKPFFLFLHTYTPHSPYYMKTNESLPYLQRYAITPVEVDKLRAGRMSNNLCISLRNFFWQSFNLSDPEDVEKLKDFYDSKIYASDQLIAKIFEQLEEKDLLKNSLIVFLSDHGEEFAEHGRFEHGSTLYREVLHIPLMVWHPSKKGDIIPNFISLLDVMPTLLESLGVPPPSEIQGQSLLMWRKQKPLLAEERGKFALMEKEWKYIVEENNEELFNLLEDPWEQKNLASTHSAHLNSFRARLREVKEENQRVRETILS